MNVFFVDYYPEQAARCLCDQHVVKMLLETAQILCSVHHALGTAADPPYRSTHRNHPCSVWARASLGNYLWLCDHGLALAAEYTARFGKQHKSAAVVAWAIDRIPAALDGDMTPPAQAMPTEYRGDDAVEAYRRYYRAEKAGFGRWKRNRPDWLDGLRPLV